MTDDKGTAGQPSTISLSALVSRAERAGKGAPPVELWDPAFCGDIDMVIHADGSWSYGGTPIGRTALVRLFSTVLRKDADGRTYLVTPVEKLAITVEDAHFQAVEMSRDFKDGEPSLTFRTNVGDVVTADAHHPMRLRMDDDGAFKPYVTVRGRLEALLTRSLAFDLADFVEEEEGGRQVVRSGGASFVVEASPIEGSHDA